MRHIVKTSLIVTLLLGRAELVSSIESITPAQEAVDLAGCRPGMWTIGSPISARAAIYQYHCDAHTTIQLVEYREAQGSWSGTIRARLDIPGTPTILPCEVNEPRGARFSNFLFVPAPGNSFLDPRVLRAWKADLDTWELKELDATDVRCYFGVNENDD
jgi:hypothetical protein